MKKKKNKPEPNSYTDGWCYCDFYSTTKSKKIADRERERALSASETAIRRRTTAERRWRFFDCGSTEFSILCDYLEAHSSFWAQN